MGRRQVPKDKKKVSVYKMKFEPLVLKQLVIECDISQADVAKALGKSRALVNLCINRGYVPPTVPEFRPVMERIVNGNKKAQDWLLQRGLRTEDIWSQLGRDLRDAMPRGHSKRISKGMKAPVIVMGDPDKITIEWEVEMLTKEAQKHFRIFRNPFIDDVLEEKDVYRSDEHLYIEAAMTDAAKHAGFLAVIGEVQSGKSIMRRHVVAQLQREDNVRVIYPQIIDKNRATAASLCDAIVADISSEKIRVKLEEKSRQVHRLLLNRHKQGHRHVIIIEEAHDLPLVVLKLLKRFYELEDGYTKLLGIILIGQPELKEKLNEGNHPDMREVIRRIQIAEIKGLNGNIKDYLTFKFKRINVELGKIMKDEALDALGARLTTKDGRTGKKISHAYPGLVNNYAAKALNLAAEMGEPIVTADVVMAI